MSHTKTSVNIYINEHKGLFLLFLIITLAAAFVAPLKSFILQWLIDAQTKSEAVHFLILGIIIIIITFVLETLSRNIFSKVQCESIASIRNRCMKSILSRNMKDYGSASSSEEISLLTNDMKMLSDDYFSAMFQIILYGGMLFFALCMYIYIDPSLLLFVMVAAIAPLVLPRAFDKRLKNRRSEFSVKSAGYVQNINEIMNGYEVIYGFGAGKRFEKTNRNAAREWCDSEYAFGRLMNYSITMSSFLSNSLFFFVLLLGMFLVFEGKITLGFMVAATNLSNFVIAPCQVISQNCARIRASKKIRQKIEEGMELTGEAENQKTNILTGAIKDIRADHVGFTYEDSKEAVLKDASFECKEKEKIAFVGQSGCGKSTIAKLLYGYLDNGAGSIYFNGIDRRNISLQNLHELAGYVTQDAYIFHDTIRNNICLYEEYSDEEIEKALDAVGLREYVVTLENGIDMVINENVKNLSGGQLQRIALARIIIRKYDMVIVDEVTSNLDPEITEEVMKYLLALDCMVIVITHDIFGTYMEKFDKIYEVSEGKIIEKGAENE